MPHAFRNFLHGLLSIAFSAGAWAAPFVAPAEENPPFRRDLLPIDTDSMATLSKNLVQLSCGLPLETAPQRRAAAQSLALALALDPANSAARDILAKLVEGKPADTTEPNRLITVKAHIWHIHGWLNTPEAGDDGNILGEMLGDALSVLDPENPLSPGLRGSTAGRWDDLVAPLPDFEETAVAEKETDPFEDIEPGTTFQPVEIPGIVLSTASLGTVLHVYDEAFDTWDFRPTSLEMKASARGGAEFGITVSGSLEEQEEIEKRVSRPIRQALEKAREGLPAEGLIAITVNGGGSYSAELNDSAINGPAFVLANSAFTGVEPEATVLVSLDSNSRLVAPDFFWRSVHALHGGKGGRLVVPEGTEEYFTAMLALERPEFLLKYEVLVASSPQEFMELCAKTPSEKHAAASASFREIREKAEGSVIRTYLANRFVRQRLQEIIDAAPYHLSAKLLALQGAGDHPRTLSRKILASEIWRAVSPIDSLSRSGIGMADTETVMKIEKTYETMRADLDSLERYTDIRDRTLVGEATNLATTVRTLSRAMKSRTSDFGDRYRDIYAVYSEMASANAALLRQLSEHSGDPLVEKRPRRIKLEENDDE